MGNYARAFLIATFAVSLGGCGSPSMVYHTAKDSELISPVEGQIQFRLRTTNITILPPAADSSKDVSSITHTDVCDKKTTPAACLDGVLLKPTASSSNTLYSALPADVAPFTHTKLATATVDGDDTLVKTVTVSFNDNTATVITAAGTGAVAGFGIAGPYGAVGGALIVGGAAAIGAHNNFLRLNSTELDKILKSTGPLAAPDFTTLICKDDKVDPSTVNRPDKPSLMLPVALSLDEATKTDPEGSGCWHLMPEHPPVASNPSNIAVEGNGWLYRIKLGDKPSGVEDPATYFQDADNAWHPKHDFPVSACQQATVEIVWWKTAQAAMPDKFERSSYEIRVANPKYVEVLPLPKAGTINLGSVCGAQVAFGTYSGGTLQNSIDAAVKDANDIKAAQDAWKKAKSGK